MALPQIDEGTVEEIAEQLRLSNLTGKLKVIVTLDENENATQNSNVEMLDTALATLLAEADRIVPEPPIPHADPQEQAFGEIVEAKYRKMGFKSCSIVA